MKKRKIILIALLCGVAIFTFTNCGYRLSGYGKQIPEHIKTIVIPDFENKSTRILAEQYVTNAIKEEFIARSKLELIGSRANADAILEGVIVSFDVTPASITADGSASTYRLKIVLNVRFIDLRNDKIIFEGENISFSDTYDIYDIEVEELDFFSQETERLRKISERFAESIVTTILENF